MNVAYRKGLFLLAFLGWGIFPSRALASDDSVVAVLSSKSEPYQQALDGFQKAFGRTIPSYVLSEGEPSLPSGTRMIVAIGGKAALYDNYPAHVFLIYCLAPGTTVEPDEHSGRLLRIYMSPSAYLTISKFKELQPALKRLAVLWTSDSSQLYIDQKKDIAQRLGVELISGRVRSPEDLPDELRALEGKIDGIWLPPDAAMVTPKNFTTIKEFCLANAIPFYAPSEALVEQGATASVSTSFKEVGALAAQMSRQALNGSLSIDYVFPEQSHLAINLSSAKTCNLTISPELLKQADKVFP